MSHPSLLVKILRWSIYATAAIPLVMFSQYISPFHFGKIVVFRSMVEIMFALYLALIWRDRSYAPRRDRFFWAFLGFTLAYTLTTFTSVNVYQSFWGTLERMGGLYSFWHYFVFYVILVSILRTKEEWFKLLKITVVAGILSAFYGFGQRTNIEFFIGSGGRSRIFGTVGNAALFAGYQIINIFLALMFALGVPGPLNKKSLSMYTIFLGASAFLLNITGSPFFLFLIPLPFIMAAFQKDVRVFFFLAAEIMAIAVFMTAVRGSVLGISVGLFVFTLLYFMQSSSQKTKKTAISILAIGIIFIGLLFALRSTPLIEQSNYLRRITDISLKSPTVQTRFWAWEAGLKGWKETPKNILVGVGPENFNIPFSKYFNPKFFEGTGSETLFDRAHNMFVEVLVTMGLVGFLTYVLLLGVILQSLWKLKERPDVRIPAISLFAMTIAYVIHNSFIFDTSANFVVFFTALGFISYLHHSQQPQHPVIQSRPISSSQMVLATILCILALILVYQTNIKTAKANRATTRAIVAGWLKDYNGAVLKHREAVAYDVAGRYEYRNRFAQYLLDYSAESTITPEVAAVIQEAIVLEEKNATENPSDYLPELYLSRLNIILGKSDAKSPFNDEALRHSAKALSYSPTFIRTYYEVGQGYLNKHDYPKAIEAFRQAYELNPQTSISQWYLGAAYITAGDIDQGLAIVDEAIAKGYILSKENYFMIANLYIKRGDYNGLVAVYRGLIQLEPNNATYHASLAVAYVRLGKIDEAVSEARLAAQIDPTFVDEARKFVEQLGRKW